MKYLFLFIVASVILFPKETNNQTIDIVQYEWDKFCRVWMAYVNKYPNALNARCCEIDHPSNNILKEGWEGESLLLCLTEKI